MAGQNILDILIRVKGQQQAKDAMNVLRGAVQQLGFALGLGGVTAGMIAFGKQSYLMAGQAERLGRGTDNLARSLGASGKAMTEAITGASKHTISGVDAMQMANKAMLLDVVKNEQEMSDLARIAVVLGQAMGKDAASSVDDLTTALGRQSPLILDNLGIKMNLTEAEADYARALGKTADQLTDVEKKTAFMQAAWEKAREKAAQLGGEVQEDRIGQIEALTAAWTDFQTEFGKFLTDSGVIGALTDLVTQMKEGAIAYQQVFGKAEAGPETQKAAGLAQASTAFAIGYMATPEGITHTAAAMAAGQSLEEILGDLASGFAQDAQMIGLVNIEAEGLQQELGVLDAAMLPARVQAADYGTAIKETTAATTEATQAQKDYQSGLEDAAETARNLAQMQIDYDKERARAIADYGKQRAQAEAQYEQTRQQQAEDYGRQQERTMRDWLRSQMDAETQYNKQRTDLAAQYGKAAQQAEADHQKQMTRMREDYLLQQEDAVAARDATAFLKNARAYDINRSRAEQDFADQRAARQAEYQQQLVEMQTAYAEQRAERLTQFALQQADRQADWDFQQARAAEQHAVEMARMDTEQQARLVEMAANLAEEQQAERDAFAERLLELETYNANYIALEKERNAGALELLNQTIKDMTAANAQANVPAMSHGGKRAGGGYAGYGAYTLGEQGREFVLNAGATSAAEGMMGGGLNQDNILAMLAQGRGAGANFSQSVSIGDPGNYAGLLAAIRAQTVNLLQEYARG